jgi:hypothetical protein
MMLGGSRQPYPASTGGFVEALAFGRASANINDANRYSGNWPWINRIRSAEDRWLNQFDNNTSPYQSAANWLTDVPAGGVVRLPIVADQPSQYGHMTAGQYKCVCPAGWTPSFSGGARWSGGTSAPGLATITFTAGSGYGTADGGDLSLLLTNNTGGAQSLSSGLAVYHVEDEADYNAGKLYRARFLEELRNLRVIRVLDWTQANQFIGDPYASRILAAAQVPTEANRYWGERNTPPSVIAKLFVELKDRYPNEAGGNAILHYTTPACYGGLLYRAVAATDRFSLYNAPGTLVPHGMAEGTKIARFGYDNATHGNLPQDSAWYVRNPTTNDFQLSATPSGAILDVTADATEAYGFEIDRCDRDYAGVYLAIFQQMYAAAPWLKIKPEHSNEKWNNVFAGSTNWLRGAPAEQFGFARSFAGAARASSHLQLLATKACADAGYPQAQITRCFGIQAVSNGFMDQMLDHVDTGVFSAGQTFANWINAGTAAGPGECLVAPYCYPQNASLVDYTLASFIADGASTWTDTQWYDAMYRGTTASAAAVAGRAANLATRAPAAIVNIYECGHHVTLSGTGAAAIGTRFKTWMDSASALAWYQDYRDRVFVANSQLHMVQYVLAGRWFNTDGLTQQWGLWTNSEKPKNPMATYFTGL